MLKMTLEEAAHTANGYAFYDQRGNEWQALELYNRDLQKVVMLPLTDDVNECPNISLAKHKGRRTLDNNTYNYYLQKYEIS